MVNDIAWCFKRGLYSVTSLNPYPARGTIAACCQIKTLSNTSCPSIVLNLFISSHFLNTEISKDENNVLNKLDPGIRSQ